MDNWYLIWFMGRNTEEFLQLGQVFHFEAAEAESSALRIADGSDMKMYAY